MHKAKTAIPAQTLARRCQQLTWMLPFVLALGACGSFQSNDIEYQAATTREPLDVPPNLITPESSDRFDIPPIGGATLSEFEKEQRKNGQSSGQAGVLPRVKGVSLERDGAQIWLNTAMPAEDVWLLMREFWQENGFVIAVEEPELGILDTDWAENRAKIPTDFLRNTLGRVFDSIYSTGERDRFRTRLERSDGGTDIFVTHRGLVEVFSDEQKEQTIWQARPTDPALEAEFLKRLMLRLGGEADPVLAAAAASAPGTPKPLPAGPERVSKVTEADGSKLRMIESFDRAWRRVGLALDRTGFTVEDRDRSKGTYYVRYIDPENPEQERPGAVARFFGAEEPEAELQSYRIVVADANTASDVSVQPPENATSFSAESAATANRMLNLIEDQLKR